MSQWGPAFRPEYAELGRLSERFPNVPIAAMTATADEATRKDIEVQLFRGNFRTFVAGFDRPNITLNVSHKGGWKNQLLDYVEQRKGQRRRKEELYWSLEVNTGIPEFRNFRKMKFPKSFSGINPYWSPFFDSNVCPRAFRSNTKGHLIFHSQFRVKH